MNNDEARAFAEKHVAVWNTHDLERIIDLYTEDAELTSPLAAQLTGGHVLSGRDALRGYFATALERHPDLQFKLVDTLLCVDSVTLYFRSINDQMVAEVLFLDESGRVRKVFAHYAS